MLGPPAAMDAMNAEETIPSNQLLSLERSGRRERTMLEMFSTMRVLRLATEQVASLDAPAVSAGAYRTSARTEAPVSLTGTVTFDRSTTPSGAPADVASLAARAPTITAVESLVERGWRIEVAPDGWIHGIHFEPLDEDCRPRAVFAVLDELRAIADSLPPIRGTATPKRGGEPFVYAAVALVTTHLLLTTANHRGLDSAHCPLYVSHVFSLSQCFAGRVGLGVGLATWVAVVGWLVRRRRGPWGVWRGVVAPAVPLAYVFAMAGRAVGLIAGHALGVGVF